MQAIPRPRRLEATLDSRARTSRRRHARAARHRVPPLGPEEGSRLGSVIYFPIILNIFLITVGYGFQGTPYITGMMVVANVYLLAWDYDRLKPIVWKPKELA